MAKQKLITVEGWLTRDDLAAGGTITFFPHVAPIQTYDGLWQVGMSAQTWTAEQWQAVNISAEMPVAGGKACVTLHLPAHE